MTRRFIIDTDTGSDDAIALVMALRNPQIQVDALTVVAGNVPLDQAVQNALYTAELCESEVPVYAGCDRPLIHPLGTAQDVHGEDGMGDIGLPLRGRTPADGHAVDVLIESFRQEPGEITLVAIGPLTNVAVALARAPDLESAIAHLYIMGGTGAGAGNITALAEYNFWADPEAAAMVMASDVPKTIIGWDISVDSATFGDDEAARVRELGTPVAEFAVDIQDVLHDYAKETTDLPGFDLPDPIAMAVAMDPTIAEMAHVRVAVVTGDGPARGVQSTDWRYFSDAEPNAHVVTHVPRQAFLDALIAGLS